MEVSQKTKTKVAIRSSSPTGHVSGVKYNSERYLDPSVHCSAVHNSQDREATSVSINRGIEKEDAVGTYIQWNTTNP